MASEIYSTLILSMFEVRIEDNTKYKAKVLTACRLFAACQNYSPGMWLTSCWPPSPCLYRLAEPSWGQQPTSRGHFYQGPRSALSCNTKKQIGLLTLLYN